jgi:uncharacterized low-complexity protein
VGADDEAFIGQLDRRREHLLPGKDAVLLRQRFPGVGIAGRGDRLGAFAVLHVVGRRRAKDIGIRRGREAATRIEAVERALASIINEVNAEAAHARHHRLDDVQRRRHGDCRIERVAAGGEYFQSCLRGERMCGADHAKLAHGRVRCGVAFL